MLMTSIGDDASASHMILKPMRSASSWSTPLRKSECPYLGVVPLIAWPSNVICFTAVPAGDANHHDSITI